MAYFALPVQGKSLHMAGKVYPTQSKTFEKLGKVTVGKIVTVKSLSIVQKGGSDDW